MNLAISLEMKNIRAHYEMLLHPPMTIQERAQLAYADSCSEAESWKEKEDTRVKDILKNAISPLAIFSGGIVPLPSPLKGLIFTLSLEKGHYSLGCIATRKQGLEESLKFSSKFASHYGKRWIDIGDSSGYIADEKNKASIALFPLATQSIGENGRVYVQDARRFTLGSNGTKSRPLTTFDSFESDCIEFSKVIEIYLNSYSQIASNNRKELELFLSVIC